MEDTEEERNTYTIMVGKPLGEAERQEDNIKID
jgi:hypothetical protein